MNLYLFKTAADLRFVKPSITLSLMFMLLSTVSFAQSNIYTVTVKDSSGAVVSGAAVTMTGENGVGLTATTNDLGVAEFPMPESGRSKIVVNANGFPTVLQDVDHLNKGDQGIEITLNIGAIRENVQVTATRTQVSSEETAVPVSVIGSEEIDRKAVRSIGDIFRTLPGTSSTGEGAFQVRPRIRGLDSNRVLILVDGERLNNSRTSTGMSGIESGIVETSQIESVEVVRGSGSVLYGTDALAGTVNIITRDTPLRSDSGFRFGADLSTFYTSNENGYRGNLAVNGSGKWFAFRAAQSLERFGNYYTGDLNGREIDGVESDGEVLNSQSHGSNTQITTRFFPNDLNVIKLNYERRRAANIGSPTLVGVFSGNFPFSDRDKFSGRYDVANLNRYLSRLTVSGFYQKQLRNFTNVLTVPPFLPFFPGQYQFSETVTDTKTVGFDLQSDWNFGGRNDLTAGASFFRDENSDQRLILTGSTPSSELSIDRSRSVPDASLANFAVFVQDRHRITDRLSITGGLRFDTFKTRSKSTEGFDLPLGLDPEDIEDLGLQGLASGLNITNHAFTGDAGIVFDATRNVTLTARIGRSFRTPNIFERFFTDYGSIGGFVVGNPELKPESGINFDTGVKFRTSRFNGSVNYFNNYYRNFLSTPLAMNRNGEQIVIDLPAPQQDIEVYQTKNVSKARIQGIEVEFEAPIKLFIGSLTPYGNFTYLRGDDVDNDEPLDFISPYRTNLGIRWTNFLKNYYAEYNSLIVGKQERLSSAFLAQNLGPEPGFVTHNIMGGYQFHRERFSFHVNVGVSNLFDRQYNEQFVYAPARGRSVTIGTKWVIK